MPRDSTPRFSILLSTRSDFSLRVRLLVCLLALVQFIAPTWHVCEMGGTACCPPKSNSQNLHCAASNAAAWSTPDAKKPRCKLCPQSKNAESQSFLDSTPTSHNGENCLAKMLLGMPWQNVAPLAPLSAAPRYAWSTPGAPRPLSLASLPQPPARAPPVFS